MALAGGTPAHNARILQVTDPDRAAVKPNPAGGPQNKIMPVRRAVGEHRGGVQVPGAPPLRLLFMLR